MASHITVRGVVFSALFAALLAVLSFANIHLPGTPVPITLENLVVMLAGALLGPWYGFFSMLLVVILTALGVPLLHGSGGLSVVLGATGGYIMIWPICALLVGLLVQRVQGSGLAAYVKVFLAIEVFGSLFSYLGGVPWLMHVTGLPLSKAMVAGCYPYLFGDAVKALVATLVTMPVRRVYPPARLVGSERGQVAVWNE